MFDQMQHEHHSVSWESNPKTEMFSIRCVTCGIKLQEISFAEAVSINAELQHMVDEIRQGGSGG